MEGSTGAIIFHQRCLWRTLLKASPTLHYCHHTLQEQLSHRASNQPHKASRYKSEVPSLVYLICHRGCWHISNTRLILTLNSSLWYNILLPQARVSSSLRPSRCLQCSKSTIRLSTRCPSAVATSSTSQGSSRSMIRTSWY